MKLFRIEDMKSGWFVGGFNPTAYYTSNFEVNYRVHQQGEYWDTHYHTSVTEINLLISGRMRIQNKELVSGDIFIIEPFEITNPEFLEDCAIVCIKTPSQNDKVIVK